MKVAWGVVIAAGLALRIVCAFLPTIATPDSSGRYEPIADNIASGKGFSANGTVPEAGSQPAYPLFLAAIELLFGPGRRPVVIAQLALELAGVLCLILLARRAQAPPLAVATLALLCPVLPTIARAIWSETLVTTTLTATCLAWLACARTPARRLPWLLAGAGAAACVLTRADFVPAVALAFLVVAVYAFRRARAAAAHGLVLAALAPAVLFGAWIARNEAAFGVAQPLGGYAGQVDDPYIQWLGTWVDDLRFLAPYHWYLGQPGYPTTFPPEAGDPDERARADAALAELQKGATWRTPEIRATFRELTDEARRRRPLHTYVVVPLRRVAFTWYNVAAAYTDSLLARGAWLAFLVAALAGAAWAGKHRTDVALLLGAIVVGRSLLPLGLGIGVEPRYVTEALPACFLFASFPLTFWRHDRCSVAGA